MRTGKLSVLAVMAVLALWVSGCGTSSNIVVPDEVLDIPQDVGDESGDDTADEPIAPEDDGGDSDGPGHATPTPHGEGDGIPHAVGDKPMVSQKPDWEIIAVIPATPHDDEPHEAAEQNPGAQLRPEGSIPQARNANACHTCLNAEADE